LFFATWQITVFLFSVEPWILPGPLQIASAFWAKKILIVYHLWPTVFEAVLGLFVSVVFAIIIAWLMDRWEIAGKILYPFLILSQTIPFIVLMPLLTIWLGFGLLPKIMVIAIVCFFPTAISLFEGFRKTDRTLIMLFESMRASKRQIFIHAKWPSGLPYFFSGLKISASYSVLAAVISEWVGAENGLGILLIRLSKSYETELVFAVVIVIALLSIFFILVIEFMSRLFMPWRIQNHIIKEE
jgi:ABC-type nitrate/sulfonate/bicarbonate transport system permease component